MDRSRCLRLARAAEHGEPDFCNRRRPIELPCNLAVKHHDDPIGQCEEFFEVGANPKGVAVTDGAVWVANADGKSVTRLDLDAGETATTKVGGKPRDLVEAADRIWVSNGAGYVSALDPADGSRLGKVELAGSEPEDIAFDGTRLWVTTGKTGTVIPIDPS